MKPSAVAIARENAQFELEQSLRALGRNPDSDVHLLSEISTRYHLLALAVLLEDANQRAFAGLLALAGQTDVRLRSLDLSAHSRERAASRSVPFSDALAAGDLGTARAIAQLAPVHVQDGVEYEDDFLRFHFHHRLLVMPDDEVALRVVLDRWATVVGRAGSTHLDAARALLDRDADDLDEALDRLITERRGTFAAWRKRPDYREEIDATDGVIFVHGLALLRLAEMRGIKTRPDYEYMPDLARVPRGTPLPPTGAWMQGLVAVGIS